MSDDQDDLDVIMAHRQDLGIGRFDMRREVTAIARTALQLDVAETVLLDSGIGTSATRALITKLGITRKRANKLLAAVQKRWAFEGHHTTRSARKLLHRKRLEAALKEAHAAKHMRAVADILDKLAKLDGLEGDLPNEAKAAPDVRRIALNAIAKAVGADVVEPEPPDPDPDDK